MDDIEKLKQNISDEISKMSTDFKTLKNDGKIEGQDTQVAAKILLKFLESKPVTQEQITFLKTESIDFTKVLAIIGLQALPGSSVAIVILQKIAVKHGFSLFPEVIKDPESILENEK